MITSEGNKSKYIRSIHVIIVPKSRVSFHQTAGGNYLCGHTTVTMSLLLYVRLNGGAVSRLGTVI